MKSLFFTTAMISLALTHAPVFGAGVSTTGTVDHRQTPISAQSKLKGAVGDVGDTSKAPDAIVAKTVLDPADPVNVSDRGGVGDTIVPAGSSSSAPKNGGVRAQGGGVSSYMKGPAGASCSVTMKDGTVKEGVQSWTSGSWGGSGGWSCCLAGTSCNQNPKGPVKAPNVTRGSTGNPVNTGAGSDVK